MDTRIKERLVGAIALVAIVVIVVPELLTGQRSAPVAPVTPGTVPTQTVVIDLTKPRGANPPAQEPVAAATPAPAPAPEPRQVPEPAPPDAALGAPAHEPPAALPTPAPAAPTATPSTAASAPGNAPANGKGAPIASTRSATPAPAPPVAPPTATPPRPSAAAHGGESWVVQLGSFSSHDNAEHFAASLRAKGYKAFVSEFHGSGKVLFRVRVGPEQDRARADAIAARLAHEGHKGSVTPEG